MDYRQQQGKHAWVQYFFIGMKGRLKFIVLAFLLQGCIGLTVGTFGTTQVSSKRFSLGENWRETNVSLGLTREGLIKRLGKPKRVGSYKNCETVTYSDGLSWSGVWMYLIVLPVPIGLPTGVNDTTYYFKDGKSVGRVKESAEEDFIFGYMCGELTCGMLAGRVYPFTGLPLPSREAEIDWCD